MTVEEWVTTLCNYSNKVILRTRDKKHVPSVEHYQKRFKKEYGWAPTVACLRIFIDGFQGVDAEIQLAKNRSTNRSLSGLVQNAVVYVAASMRAVIY